MVCIFCGKKTQVTNSRLQKRNNNIWRRRRCSSCGNIFTTLETTDYSGTLRVRSEGSYKPFLADLLYSELLTALSHRKSAYIDARELANTIIKKLLELPSSPIFDPKDISQTTAKVLKRFDTRAWHRYASDHPSVL